VCQLLIKDHDDDDDDDDDLSPRIFIVVELWERYSVLLHGLVYWNGRSVVSLHFNGYFPGEPGLAGVY